VSLATASLGEIAEVAAGGGAPQNADAFTAEGTPFIRAGSLNPLVNGASESTLEHLTDEVAKEHGLRKFPRDTVVFAKSGMSATKGHIYRLRDEAYVVNHLAAIVPTERVVPEFLEHSLRVFSPVRLIQDAAYPSVRLSDVATMKIPLPPLAEQRRRADVLDRAEALRAKRRAALGQLDSLTQSLFLDLFGDPRPNTKSWPVKSLKDLGKVKTGGTPPGAKPGMFGGPIPFVTPGDLESDEPVKRTVTEEGAAEAETVRAGAALVCCIGATIGKMGKAAQRSAFNQQLNAVEWATGVDDDYGLGVLRFFKPQIATWGASTTLPILKKSSFEKIEIPVPPISLQREFARRVTAVEALKTAQRASLAELDALFATLQHRAFRGEL